jgi:hypothetical protein
MEDRMRAPIANGVPGSAARSRVPNDHVTVQ